jgi:hypothetical protein
LSTPSQTSLEGLPGLALHSVPDPSGEHTIVPLRSHPPTPTVHDCPSAP